MTSYSGLILKKLSARYIAWVSAPLPSTFLLAIRKLLHVNHIYSIDTNSGELSLNCATPLRVH